MDVREKLVEMLQVDLSGSDGYEPELIADYMLDHGVTVQEWINADERVPDEPMRCLVYTKRGEYWGYEITYYNQGFYTQYAETIYWMPIPQPPKGE